MHFKKSFNFNYLIQMMKKNKILLAFFLGIIPIVHLLYFIAVFSNINSYEEISFSLLSIPNCVGIYLFPVILSLCLFGFIYKKKSLDFTLSMPISRKSIFLTNTILGIFLLVSLELLSTLGIWLATIFCNIVLPLAFYIDYFLLFSIASIFVYIISNVAMSISGNSVTQLIVTIVFLCIIPFFFEILTYGESIFQETLRSNENVFSILGSNHSQFYFQVGKDIHYTLPYAIIHQSFVSGSNIFQIDSIMKMLVISIFGYFLGKFLFQRRKMEWNEYSFSDIKIHTIVKAMTIFPIFYFLFFCVFQKNSDLFLKVCTILFLLFYSFLYDIVTKRKELRWKESVLHFSIIVLIMLLICPLLKHPLFSLTKEVSISKEKISAYQFTDTRHSFSSFAIMRVTDKTLLSQITDALTRAFEEQDNTGKDYHQLVIEVGKKKYQVLACFLEEDYQKIQQELIALEKKKGPALEKSFVLVLDNHNVIGEGLSDFPLQTTNKNLLNGAKQSIIAKKEESQKNQFSTQFRLYSYQQGIFSYCTIESADSEILNNYVEKLIQEENEKVEISSQKFSSQTYYSALYFNNRLTKLKADLEDKNQDISDWIKNHRDDTFSLQKDYIKIFGYSNQMRFFYYTNRVEELLKDLEIEGDFYDTNSTELSG